MAFLPIFLLFNFLGSGGVVKANHSQQAKANKPPFAVSIAVPREENQYIIRLSEADPHIDVVIRNVSNQPQDLFAEDASPGHDSLRLEIFRIDGKPQAITVRRNGSNVLVRSLSISGFVTLQPGESLVREIHFTKDRAVGGIPYSGFPPMQAGETHKIRMRAVFRVGIWQAPPWMWRGDIVSKTNDYQVQQFAP